MRYRPIIFRPRGEAAKKTVSKKLKLTANEILCAEATQAIRDLSDGQIKTLIKSLLHGATDEVLSRGVAKWKQLDLHVQLPFYLRHSPKLKTPREWDKNVDEVAGILDTSPIHVINSERAVVTAIQSVGPSI